MWVFFSFFFILYIEIRQYYIYISWSKTTLITHNLFNMFIKKTSTFYLLCIVFIKEKTLLIFQSIQTILSDVLVEENVLDICFVNANYVNCPDLCKKSVIKNLFNYVFLFFKNVTNYWYSRGSSKHVCIVNVDISWL